MQTLHGQARVEGLTEPGSVIGTAHNMAPEQVRGERLDTRADIYALGVMLYQMVTGHYPFDAAEPTQVALLHLSAPAPRPSERAAVSPALDAVVLRCLEKAPERRFASVTELLAALRQAVAEPPESSLQSVPAVAAYVELDSGQSELDDARIDMMVAALELCRAELRGADFKVLLETSSSLLTVRLLRALRPEQMRETVRETRTRMAKLSKELSLRGGAAGLAHRTTVVCGEVTCREHGAETEITGGPLLELELWSRTLEGGFSA